MKKKIKGQSLNFDCIEIAAIIYQKLKESKLTSPLRVQKFLWYTQIRYYAKKNVLLFDDEFESWMYGPVLSKVWASSPYEAISEEILKNDKFNEVKKIIDHVFDKKLNLFFFTLIDETHQQEPYKKGLEEPDHKIKNTWVKELAKEINQKYLE